ncbi:glycosyltransferase family 4 protein [Mucilaginibacter sp. OK098]|uniref:glycosyltransferase family 4 protein n=1 Tax=Mucilaginibacter sp. OK098 TaxID=1855297 RepID=UPI00092195B4|nr:glycosyltransferase family 4 protein [Mucilaginibacter sp. OK098]SHN13298.1 Glycosyltransferase involved in cell wall bisynthesis [Mucilaginibacter sp. OK098]
MKRVVFFVNSMQPSGGIERVIATLANKLSVKFEITILVKDDAKSFYSLNKSIKIDSINNILHLNMHNKLSRIFNVLKTIFSTSKSLQNYFEKNNFDYYYVTHPLSVLEFYVAKINPQKVIISEHASKEHYNIIYRVIKKLLYKRCHVYVVPTIADTLSYKEDGIPAVTIPHFRSELPYVNANKKNRIVLNIGRFTSDKQQRVLLNVWKKIISNKEYSEWKLFIIGSGELEAELYTFVSENNLQDTVKFFPPTSNIEEYYLKASIFALTSRSEGYGMVLLEAISFGLPCVSFDCPSGPKDIIQDKFNGYLVSLGREKEFELRLTELMYDGRLQQEIGLNAYNSSQAWSEEIIFNKWLEILN